jgi:hypothetical protein
MQYISVNLLVPFGVVVTEGQEIGERSKSGNNLAALLFNKVFFVHQGDVAVARRTGVPGGCFQIMCPGQTSRFHVRLRRGLRSASDARGTEDTFDDIVFDYASCL